MVNGYRPWAWPTNPDAEYADDAEKGREGENITNIPEDATWKERISHFTW
jgi:hypothetical protein